MSIFTKYNIITHFSNSAKNLAGTIIYSFCQWLKLIIVIHIAGYTISGEFSLVMSFSNIFFYISLYNLRNFQLSDVKNNYNPSQYSGTYIITCSLALLSFFVVLPFTGYNISLILCCIIYMIFKLLETLSQYNLTYMQINNKFTNILLSNIFKSIIPITGFSISLFFNLGLFFSLCVLSSLYLLILLIYDRHVLKGIFPKTVSFLNCNNLLKQCLPLMISTLILPFMLYMTRNTVSVNFGNTELGFYSAITMVIVIIHTMAGSIFVVLLPTLAKKYFNNEIKVIIYVILATVGIIVSVTLVTVVLAYFFGNIIFSFIFGEEILPYMYLLTPSIIISSLLSIMTFFTMFLIAIHKRIYMLASMISGVILLSIFVKFSTEQYGMLGTTYIFIFSLLLVILMQCMFIIRCFLTANYSELSSINRDNKVRTIPNSAFFSVIVPIYNDENNLRRCLDSIINQSENFFEILLIDDGSTDSSPLICEDYSARDDRIHVFHKQHEGISKTRQFGIERAKCEYIIFIDSDDYIYPHYIKTAYSSICLKNADIIFIAFNEENMYKKVISLMNRPDTNNINNTLQLILEFKLYSCMWNVIIKREFYLKNNIRFSELINYGEDTLFITDILLHNPTISYIPAKIYYHSFNPSSFTRKYAKQRLKERTLFHNELNKLFIKYNRKDLSKSNFFPLNDKYHLLDSLLFNRKEYHSLYKVKLPFRYLIKCGLHKYLLLLLADTALFGLVIGFIKLRRRFPVFSKYLG